METTYDFVVLGGGPAGYAAALRAAQLGLSVALVEKDRVGGTCLHRGCIPTKALLHAAEIVDTVAEGAAWGIKAGIETIDWARTQTQKDRVVRKLFLGLQGLLRGRKIEVVASAGRLVGPGTVAVDDRVLTGKNVLLATGSVPKPIPGVAIDGARIITSDHALSLEAIPKSVIVLGAGSVGAEFASLFCSLGARVTLIEALAEVLPLEDPDLGKELRSAFIKRGIEVLISSTVSHATASENEVVATVSVGGEERTIKAEYLLVAVGRSPATAGLGYEEAGIALDRGFVSVSPTLETSVPGIYAAGDLIPTIALAHCAFSEGVAVAGRLAGQALPPIDYDQIPRATYSYPEVASVGITQARAVELGHDVITEVYPFRANAKAAIIGQGGFAKVVAAKGGSVLGVHLVGPRVSELIAEAMLVTGWGAVPEEVALLVHPHPTLSEALGEAHLALAGRSLHVP